MTIDGFLFSPSVVQGRCIRATTIDNVEPRSIIVAWIGWIFFFFSFFMYHDQIFYSTLWLATRDFFFYEVFYGLDDAMRSGRSVYKRSFLRRYLSRFEIIKRCSHCRWHNGYVSNCYRKLLYEKFRPCRNCYKRNGWKAFNFTNKSCGL